jgi:ribonucleotide monophosphatase NagD (HAD superfamily)
VDLLQPNDIKAAEYGGALAIGVCTGVFSRDDLEAASKSGRAVILDDLKDSAVFLKACGLE